MIKQLFIFCISLFIRNFVFAQDHVILDKFDLFEGDNRVFVRCVISSGSICNGIKIYRAEDTISFDLIGEIPGVCGNISSPVGYDFIDELPIVNKKSFYKLELGGYGFTKVKSIQLIDTKKMGFQVRPNPARGKSVIYFENDLNQSHSIEIFDFNGQIKESKIGTTQSFEVDLNEYTIGPYFFIITNLATQNQVIGKLFVLE